MKKYFLGKFRPFLDLLHLKSWTWLDISAIMIVWEVFRTKITPFHEKNVKLYILYIFLGTGTSKIDEHLPRNRQVGNKLDQVEAKLAIFEPS